MSDIPNKYDIQWSREDRAYHFVHRIPCRIVAVAGKRVRIAALLRNGSEREHLVKATTLKHEPCNCFSECKIEADFKAKGCL